MSEQHAKVVTLRVSVKADDPRTMEEFIQDLRDGIQADSPSDPQINVFSAHYLVDGHNIDVADYNRGVRTPVGNRNPFPTGRAREARRQQEGGRPAARRTTPTKPVAKAVMDDAMAKALERMNSAKADGNAGSSDGSS
jgi:hypothetical protein